MNARGQIKRFKMGAYASTSERTNVTKADIDYVGSLTAGQGAEAQSGEYILILDSRVLDRECLSRSLSSYDPTMKIAAVASIEEWRKREFPANPSAILLVMAGNKANGTLTCDKVEEVAAAFKLVPVIVIADSDDLGEILKAIDCGARGYIPTSVNISVAAEAISLARAGGVFVPASSLLANRDALSSVVKGTSPLQEGFTPREIQVAEALRRGKANKIIAYEMNLCESTVKVHIRNIMKKLNVTNRTQVAFKLK
ncbi:DNA-binding NarL/FixJ family response regulator [Pseudorhizobium tarimense]|uniref:DNA-binding NarL/FixJ family response regulator n=1 Tax=Pseudorhizobium tarimense TaxID=1079109 RepID=A0ABV2H494_9HYPH|nr:response regulator transcription factor [Pseudorhizobium tarimense]MCJ8518603.1 response regulator transcription factor [Pseudorhizobium tarimense]